MGVKHKASLALVGSILLASPSKARDRVDTVELRRGDRVTCEIITMRSRSLSIRTMDLGTVAVDWPQVAALVSPQLFEVELVDGTRIAGSLARSAEPGRLDIHTDSSVVSYPFVDVAGIEQLGRTVWQSRRGYLDFGLDYASANEDAQLSLGAQLELASRRWRSVTSFAATVSDDVDSEQRTRGDLQSVAEVPLGRRWLLLGAGLYERNDDLGLDARLTASAAAVWIPHRWPGGYWGLGAGVAESQEKYAGESSSTSTTAAVATVRGDYDRFGPFGTQASFGLLYLPMLTGPTRHRVEARGSLRQRITNDFTLSFQPYYSYDSRPPRPQLQKEDWGLVSSVGWKF